MIQKNCVCQGQGALESARSPFLRASIMLCMTPTRPSNASSSDLHFHVKLIALPLAAISHFLFKHNKIQKNLRLIQIKWKMNIKTRHQKKHCNFKNQRNADL